MLLRYFETLKETLKIYVNYKDEKLNTMDLINTDYFRQLYIIQFRFIQDSFRSFVLSLKEATNNSFQSIIDTRMAAFIIFIIALGVAYLILWTPFVNNLNREVRKIHAFELFIDLENKVNANYYPYRGHPKDSSHTRVLAQPEFLPEQVLVSSGKFLR